MTVPSETGPRPDGRLTLTKPRFLLLAFLLALIAGGAATVLLLHGPGYWATHPGERELFLRVVLGSVVAWLFLLIYSLEGFRR